MIPIRFVTPNMKSSEIDDRSQFRKLMVRFLSSFFMFCFQLILAAIMKKPILMRRMTKTGLIKDQLKCVTGLRKHLSCAGKKKRIKYRTCALVTEQSYTNGQLVGFQSYIFKVEL